MEPIKKSHRKRFSLVRFLAWLGVLTLNLTSVSNGGITLLAEARGTEVYDRAVINNATDKRRLNLTDVATDMPVNLAMIGAASVPIMPAGTLLFSETFDEAENATTGSDNTGGVSWTALTPGALATTDYLKVVGGVLEAKDPNTPAANWTTGTINTTGYSSIDFTMDLSEEGPLEACGLTNQTCLGASSSQVIGDETEASISSATMHFGEATSGDRRGRVQFLYTAAELNAAGFTGAGKISSLWFKYVFASNPANTVTNLTMKMGCTGLTSLGDGAPTQTVPEDRWDFETGLTQVATYATVAPPAAFMFPPSFAWVEFPINEPGMDGFLWDGVSNILVEFCTPDLQTDRPFFLSSSTTSENRALYLYDFAAGDADGCSYPAGKKSTLRPVVRMDFCSLFPNVNLSVSANSGTEADQTTITVTATADAAVTGDQTIDLGVSGTGITGTDYNLSNSTITILSGQTMGSVTFTIQDDVDIEGDETATLTISNPSAGLTLGATTAENITITDNDPSSPTVDLSVSANTGTEAATTAITVTATASSAVTGDQTVDLGVTGTGITGTDYTLSNATITILNGQTTGTVTFTVQDDADIEGDETATLTISNPSAGLTLGTTTTQNVVITDNDFPKVELSVSANTGTEAAGTVITVTATASSAVTGDQTVDLGVSGAGITGTDYTLSNAAITILNGQSTGTVTFTVQDDADVEGAETATLTMSNPSAGVTLGVTTTQNVSITDNDSGGSSTPYVNLPSTENTPGNNQRGIMFNITTTNEITVNSFDHTLASVSSAPLTFEIYYRNGGFNGSETTAADWTFAGSVTGFNPDNGNPTSTEQFSIPIPIDLTIPAGQTYGFYLTFTSSQGFVTYSNGTTTNDLLANDANLEIRGGVALDYPFILSANNRASSVVVHYNTEGDPAVLSTLTTTEAANVLETSADLGGEVTSGGGFLVTERGVVYAPTATNANPQIGGTGVTKEANGTGTGVFNETVSGLTAGTQYSYAAFATNGVGTAYGVVKTFTTTISAQEVNLSTSANTGTEAAGTAITVTATAAAAVSGDQTLDIGVSGTGITGTDYTLSNTTITILDGQTTGSVTFTIQDDADVEGTETATLTISNPSAGVTLGSTTTQNVVITDNDNSIPVISLEDATLSTNSITNITFNGVNTNSISVTDADADNQTVTVALTGGGNFTLSGTTNLTVSGNGTANVSLSGPLADINNALDGATFDPTSSVGQHTLAISTNDGEVAVGPSNILIGVYPASATLDTETFESFTNNDPSFTNATTNQTFTFSPTTFGVTEFTGLGIGNSDFIVDNLGNCNSSNNLTGSFLLANNQDIYVKSFWLFPSEDCANVGVNGTITIRGKNGSSTLFTKVISSGELNTLQSVNNGFTFIELDENAGFAIDELEFETSGSISYVAVDDFEFAANPFTPSVDLSVSANAGTETAGTVITVTATASQAVAGDQTVDLGVSGTGITGTDYTLSGTTITILNGQTTGTVTFTVQDDADIEGAETATLTISNPSAGVTLGSSTTQNIAITDNDFPSVDLSVSANAGTEAAGTVITVTATASQAVDGDQTVDLGVSGTGIANTDYALSNTSITILDGATTGAVTFTIQDDADIEGTETATLTISNPSAGVTLGSTTTQNVTITDNDFPSVDLSVSANAGTEAASTVITVTATASQAVDGDQTVDLGVSGTGITGTDYSLSGSTITILNGQTTGTVTFTVLDDADIEGTETAILTISNPSVGLTLGSTTTQNIAITDNDFPTVELSVSANAGTEAAGTVITVTATASQAVDGDHQTVDLGVSGTGITGTDYSLSGATITILDGQTTGTVTFTIQDDADIEGTETATLTISNPSAGLTLGSTTTQNIAITDNDFPTVDLSVSANTGTEAGTTVITVTATASQAVDGDQTVDLGVSGTGITGTDYSLSGTTITMLDGQTTGTVTFTIQDDADIEGTETATLTISNPSAGVTLGSSTTQNIAITDNDFPSVDLSVSANAGTEAAGTVITVTATASQAVDGDQTVDLGVSGIGIANTDYALSNTSITILDGATTGTVTFTIQDDADIEGTETATLTISNPSAGLTLGSTTTQNIAITDNDFPSVDLSISANAGTEAAGTVITVTATASQAVDGDQTVDLGVSGTGIANTDYALNNATITIFNGQTTGTVTFTIQDDADIEGTETATLTISNPSAGLTLGSTTTQNIAITDNDFPTVDLSVSANTGTEAGTTVITVTATASQAVDGDQTVDLGVSGTGITGTDYSLSGTTITMLDGQTTGTVTFTIQDDADNEGTETATLTISNPSAGLTLGTTTTQNIVITDNDFPTVDLSVSANVGTEAAGTAITVTATASQAVDGDQTVDLGVSGTGIAGTDYSLSGATITMLDGTTTGTVTFTIQDDADIEGVEIATLTISNPSAGVILGTTTTQNIAITDNDFPTVELSVSANTGSEAAGTVITVTATASQAVDGDQTIDLGVSGTGIAGTDYSLSGTTITILNGQTTGTVTFTVQDDADIEGTETATLTISNPSAGLTLGSTTTQNIVITDNDFPTVDLSVSANAGTEAASTVITVTATASQAVDGDQTVDLGVSGTGITGTDYSLSGSTITILNGQTTGTVTFTVLDDADIEGTETAILTISNPSVGLTLGSTTTQNIAITDNDFPTVELSVSANAGTEAAGTVITVTATASQAVDGDQTVDLGVSGTGITGTDYSLSGATITILDGQTTGMVAFTIQDDADIEGDETATLTISNPSAGLTLGSTTTQSIVITDNDFPTVDLSVSANTGTEAGTTVITVTATASQAVDGDQTVDLGVSGTGIAGTDYSLSGTTITILNGQTTGMVIFTVQDDTDIEGTETATLTISNPSVGLTLGSTTTQNIAITDNDFPTVELSVSANAGTEAAGTVITVTATASQAVDGDQTVDLGVSGTGITGTDYSLSGTTITILNGQTTGTVTFIVLDDADIEGTETATLTISNPSAGVTLGSTTTQNIAITDNDFPTVELSVSGNTGTEAAGTVITVTATSSQAVDGDQTVDLGVGGTGITGTDYTLSNATITILNGQTTGTVTFTVLDDADVEGPETAVLTLNSPSAGISLGSTTSQNITITDNDSAPNPIVSLSVSANSGTEVGTTVITVTATASQAVSGDQTVDLGVSGTGITGTDYSLSGTTITILNGQTTGTITFTIQDDADIEGAETATLTISNPSVGVTLGSTTTQNIVITDNDFPTVELSVSANAGTEAAGTVITVTATSSQAVDGDQTVDLSVSGTGITSTDYTLSGTTITILNGQTTGTITFTIQDDADIEGTETATLTISNPSVGVTLGSTTTQNIAITDNDFPTVELSVSANTGTEAAGTVITVTATSSQAVDGDQTVDLGVSGTGITGTDYSLSANTITILNGQTTGTVTFTVQDDADIEGTETAVLTLNSPSAGISLGSTTSQNITITDNDSAPNPIVSLSVSANTGTEVGTTVITVTATASQAISGDQTVDLGVSGTGITGTDYSLSGNTITILNGQTTGTVTFTVQDDADIEGTETATLTISNPSAGLTLGSTTTQSIAITDNDFPSVELSVSANVGTEAAGTVITVTATASQAVDGDQTIDLGVSGTGITGTDYSLSGTTITILNGQTTGTVTFTVQDDADVEGPETAVLTLNSPSAGISLGSTTSQNITITDNDSAPNPVVSLSVSANTGTEVGTTVITVTATASQAVSGDQTVDLGVSGTGITGTDYSLSGNTITILNGQTTGTVTFTVQDDADIEGTETATLTISNPSVGVTLGSTTTQNIVITDNDFPTVELSVSANAGTEAAGTVITVTATSSQAVDGDQTVDLGVSGTGITGTDYTLSGNTITILNGQTTGTVTFTVQDDADIEGSETTTLTISNPSAGLTLGSITTQNIIITDNDFPTVDLSVSANSGTEVAGTVITVTATSSQAVDGDQTIDLGVSGTGITGTDYTLSNATITILNGLTTGTVTFTVQDDADVEGPETAVLMLNSPSAGISLGSTTSQNITITDNDSAPNPVVSLSVSANSGTEAGTTVITVTATASQAVSGDQTVDLGVSGTGITGTDYSLSGATITILNGQTTGTVTFTIQDDADIEGSETATLTISNPSAGLTLGSTTTQSIAITDNDFPSVELSVSANTGTEADQTVITVTATASQAVIGDQTVDLGVGGTGITSTDYSLSGTTITILNGQTTGTVTFTVQDDADIEGSETATLTISNPSAGMTLGTTTTQNIAITDNDFPTVELSVSANTGTEAAGTVIMVTATSSQAVDGDQTVDLGVSGTGIAGTDYSLSGATITILNGQTTGTVTFTIQDDADIEGTETATLTISNPSAGLTLGSTTTQNIVITDNDFPTVELSVSANTGSEAAGTVITVTATASQAVDGDQTVDLGVSGTGITGTDYTLSGNTITILNGQSTGTVTFTVQDDADIEGTETAMLTISNPSAGLTLGSTTTQNIVITDNDFPTVELSVSANTGSEAAGTVITVTATASQAVDGDQTIDLGVSGTGITGTDYTLSNATITILNGLTTGTVTFTVQDDADVEGPETAVLMLNSPSAGISLGSTTSQNITITDNDSAPNPIVSLSVSANTGTEVGTTVITVTATASQAVSGDQTVDLGVSGTGITGTDYSLSGATITILNGQTTGTVTFTIQDDADIEGTETATLTISNPSAGLTLGTTTTQNIVITDNDFPTVDLSVSANAGTEAAGTVITVTATASQPVDGSQTVDLGVSGTGITSTDYSLSGTTITILNGQTTGTVTFTVQDDADVEGPETAVLTLNSPSAGISLGSTTSKNITITDNDSAPNPVVSLSVSANTGTEVGTTVITVTATASQAVSGDQTVDLGVSGTGITGTDYSLTGNTITILNGQTTGTVTFTIQDDADIEGDETATLTISNPSAGLTLGSTTAQNIVITDNDFPTIDLSVSANTGTEAAQTVITVTATASQVVSGDQTIDLSVTGTGITGTDYALSNTTITILNGQTTGTVTFTIQDDADIEGDETATLTISNPSAGLTLGSTTAQNIVITDNDFPTVDLSVSANTGTEAAQTVITVTATSSQAVDGDQTVDLGVSGTGITSTDYSLSGTTVTILNGQTTGTVTFTIQDDTDIEGTETATLSISNPPSGLTLGTNTSEEIIITDDDEINPDLGNITIIASPANLVSNGTDASLITVQLVDTDGNPLTRSGGTVVLATTGSALLTPVVDNNDGTYIASITNTVAEVVTITGQLEGMDIVDNAEVEFTPDNTDTDGDGVFDRLEDLNGNGDLEDDDTDEDGLPNYLDTDDDGDSIPTRDEDLDNDGDPQNDDTDGDEIPNYLDNDDDDDGILTIDEDANNNGDLFDDDTDGDGLINFLDPVENMVVDKLFSPNGDGINDVLQIRDAEKFPNNKVSIFNRQGNLIFELEAYDNRQRGWNGIPNRGLLTSGDKIAPNGTYFYVIEPNDGSETITGFFVLKR